MESNAYYHEFSVGFNWWMVVGGVAIVLMALIGAWRYEMFRGRIRCAYREKLLSIVSGVFAAVFGVMLFVESISGIIQFLDNNLSSQDDPVWSLIMAPVAILIAAVIFWLLLYGVGKVASWAKLGYLREKKTSQKPKKLKLGA